MNTKICSKKDCNNITRGIKQRYCKECHARSMRKNRPKHKELNEEQKLKANARSYLNTYVNRGLINKEPCSKCNNPIAEAHHEDYNKPLEVIWFCRECHLEYHKLFIDKQ